ncbi:hypothetical protein WN982_28015 [Paraburkholderia sp. IMGN_8]|uniref:hypothetical protein n=1 Tax=Paraburkholderia sp. IMGN_8 TaxID=3136564 RepID=UPI0031017BD9
MDRIDGTGGMQRRGTVEIERREPTVLIPWRGRALALGLALMDVSGVNLAAALNGLEQRHPLNCLVDGCQVQAGGDAGAL